MCCLHFQDFVANLTSAIPTASYSVGSANRRLTPCRLQPSRFALAHTLWITGPSLCWPGWRAPDSTTTSTPPNQGNCRPPLAEAVPSTQYSSSRLLSGACSAAVNCTVSCWESVAVLGHKVYACLQMHCLEHTSCRVFFLILTLVNAASQPMHSEPVLLHNRTTLVLV